jgi:hypothetical protein
MPPDGEEGREELPPVEGRLTLGRDVEGCVDGRAEEEPREPPKFDVLGRL